MGVGQLVARTLELMSSWWKTQLGDWVLLCCLSYNFPVAWRYSSTVQFHIAVIWPQGDKLRSVNTLRSLAGDKDKNCLPNTEYKELGKSLKFIIFSNSLTTLDLLYMVQTRIWNYWEYLSWRSSNAFKDMMFRDQISIFQGFLLHTIKKQIEKAKSNVLIFSQNVAWLFRSMNLSIVSPCLKCSEL